MKPTCQFDEMICTHYTLIFVNNKGGTTIKWCKDQKEYKKECKLLMKKSVSGMGLYFPYCGYCGKKNEDKQ